MRCFPQQPAIPKRAAPEI